jgi:hypothetical protein
MCLELLKWVLQGRPKHTESSLTKSSPTKRFQSFFGLGIIVHNIKYKVFLGYATKVTKPHTYTTNGEPGAATQD